MQHRWEVLGTPTPQPALPLVPRWHAAWSELALLGSDGAPDATVSATAYEVLDDTRRPVVFFWNGGPGASSSPLHLEGFGPHLRGPDDFSPNPDTLLPEADLVFIDPVGTGFSRILREDAHSRLLQTPGDAKAVATFIRAWLQEHRPDGTAVHLIGESYGGYRLAAVLEHLDGLDVRSLTLVSPLLSPTNAAETAGNDLASVFQLPVLAATHAHHAGGDPREAWAEAEQFAASTLLPLLFQADAAPADEVRAAATTIASLIGLPVEQVLDAGLRVGSEEFLRTRDAGLLIGRLDTRVTGPVPEPVDPDRPPAADDPVLGLDGGTVIRSPRVAAHLRTLTDVPLDREYIGLSLDLNFAWDWSTEFRTPGFTVDRAGDLGAFAASRPEMLTLLIGGIFDLATPHLAALHSLQRSGIPLAQRRTLLLDCGHSLDHDARGTARAAIAALIHDTDGGTR